MIRYILFLLMLLSISTLKCHAGAADNVIVDKEHSVYTILAKDGKMSAVKSVNRRDYTAVRTD